MGILKEREETILEYVIRDYIRTAEPVSSNKVAKKARVDVSPATVRNIMAELDESGFLEQPHISSGRIPTERAYRYFVDNFMEDDDIFFGGIRAEREKKTKKNTDEEMRDFARMASEMSGMFTTISGMRREIFFGGIDEIFREPEFKEYEVSLAFARILDDLPEITEKYHKNSEEPFRIYVGSENLFSEGDYFSSIYGTASFGEGTFMAFSIGPKRMDYERGSRAVREILKKLI